ncbi:hypothetical protein [Legionella sp. km772]|uniref:hypothetical protein n=1 Tax=Legionella sp. km772 TaxID=2498111 RepID=UPI000F8C3E3D|nr:hypothetical protein [Legionella sp. km772]RUR07129.1 hypothetical protein ELY15_12480 [Legionella sp. km772]
MMNTNLEEEKHNKELATKLLNLISQIQFEVNTSLDKLNLQSTRDPSEFTDTLQQISTHVQQLSQILHHNE